VGSRQPLDVMHAAGLLDTNRIWRPVGQLFQKESLFPVTIANNSFFDLGIIF
jgi:hypothetical protein